MNTSRRRVASLGAFAALVPATLLRPGRAQDGGLAQRPIRIVVSSAPGALTDVAARLYAERMSAFLRQSVLVENIAGASSVLAARQVAKAAPDGLTLLATANTIVIVPQLNRNAGYAVKDFAAVGEMARSPSLLAVGGGSPFRTLNDLITAARQSPGGISYGSGGVGTTTHLPVELLARQARVSFNHIPYKGAAPAVPDVVSGRVHFLMGTATSMAELIRSGALRALAISSDARSPRFPDLPTFRELGYPDASFEVWVGILAPAGLPAPLRSRLAEAMEAARADAEIVRRLEGLGQVISAVRTPAQFEAVLRAEEEKFGTLIREAQLTGGG